ncbi:unnamed protein product, partial [Rotaria magnacalcarata]
MMIYRWIICIVFLSLHIKYGRAQGSAFRDIPNVYFTNLSAVSPTASPLTTKTTQYIRDQLVLLTEHFQSISLRSTDRVMRKIYMQSLDTFLIDKRNLTQLVREMANYTNRAIMKKLEAIRTLVTITEQSYRRFAETDEKTRNATAQYMLHYGYLSSKDVLNVTINSTYEDSSLRTTIDGLNNDNVDKSVSSGTTTPLTYTKATSEASSEYETEE